jgi:hypothetical protein
MVHQDQTENQRFPTEKWTTHPRLRSACSARLNKRANYRLISDKETAIRVLLRGCPRVEPVPNWVRSRSESPPF